MRERGYLDEQGYIVEQWTTTRKPANAERPARLAELRALAAEEEDFKVQFTAIQEAGAAAGHMATYFPKLHPELNFIERYWARVKHKVREHGAYTTATLKADLARILRGIPQA